MKKSEKQAQFNTLNDLYNSIPNPNRRERFEQAKRKYRKMTGTEIDLDIRVFLARRNMIKNAEVPLNVGTRQA